MGVFSYGSGAIATMFGLQARNAALCARPGRLVLDPGSLIQVVVTRGGLRDGNRSHLHFVAYD